MMTNCPFLGKASNYIGHESDEPEESDSHDSEEPSEPGAGSVQEEHGGEYDNGVDEMPVKVPVKVKTENGIPGEVGESNLDDQDDPDHSKEPKFIGIQIENTTFDCYDFSELIKENLSRVKTEGGLRSGRS